MISIAPLLAIIAIVTVGAAVIWANSSRPLNRVFFTLSIHCGCWLFFVQLAVESGEPPHWVRLASALGALLTPHMWLLKEASLCRDRLWGSLSGRKYIWFSASLVLTILIYSNLYIRPSIPGGRVPNFGPGYFIYTLGTLVMYALLAHETIRQIRRHTGLQRVELQVLLLGGTATAFAVLGLMITRGVLHTTWPIRAQPFVVLALWAATVVTITTHRIFDARQILLVSAQKILLVGSVSVFAYGGDAIFRRIIPDAFALLATTVMALWFAGILNAWLNNIFQFYPQATGVRQAAFAVAKRESRLENLEPSFVNILKGWGQAEVAVVASGGKDLISGTGVEISGDHMVVVGLRNLRWVTPERLAREKSTPERTALGVFLEKHKLGVLVLGEGPTLTALIGVGVAASRRPFTYPQVMQLMELASIIESAMERAHFSVKAQHAEQLATVGLLGASLAHEIRNPLVSIKTFVQLLPNHHQDPAFREKFFTLISDEVSRIDRLTEQLLDLASPRAYVAELIELHPVLRASLDLVTVKAANKRIQFLTEFRADPDRALTDPSAAKQVLLNLCFNAIQAVENRQGDRWVKVATSNVLGGVEMTVSDSGPGIAPEIRSRLFQPFQTTKSSGFGLGLAICSDILSGINATISVDPSAPGIGATFRVTFPCPVSSS